MFKSFGILLIRAAEQALNYSNNNYYYPENNGLDSAQTQLQRGPPPLTPASFINKYAGHLHCIVFVSDAAAPGSVSHSASSRIKIRARRLSFIAVPDSFMEY